MKNIITNNKESGNVLFLILIAVALFAALSYAVTQSTRSGGGSTERETSILSGASLTQYPSGLRTSVLRLVLGGVGVEQLEFDPPSAITTGNESVSLFHPQGGGALFQDAPANIMESNTSGTWFFNANWDVPDIGLSDTSDGNDLVAFLPGVARAVCSAVNEELNFFEDIADCTSTDGTVPDIDSSLTEANIRANIMRDTGGIAFATGDQENLSNAGASCTAFTGQSAGCFYDLSNTEYVYYSVLLER